MACARSFCVVLVVGVVLAVGWVSSAWAGPVPSVWGTDAAATVAQPLPLARGQVLIGGFPTVLDFQRGGNTEYVLVTVNAGVARAGDEPAGLGRAHLFLLRRRVDEPDPERPWEQIGGQIDELDPARDGDSEDLGVRTARLACADECWVAYTQEDRLMLARPVAVRQGFSWEREQLDAGTVRGVGELAVELLEDFDGVGTVAWTQRDRDSATHSTVRVARVIWPPGRKPITVVVSLGAGARVQLAHGALMVDSADQIRVYSTRASLWAAGDRMPFVTLARAQATGRALLAASPSEFRGEWMVAEPAPGGTLVHVIALDDEQDTTSYRFVNPAWLPSGAGPMALTVQGARGWMVVGMPGWPGSALVQITGRPDDTLGAVVYQIPNLPAPVGLDVGELPRVIPEVIGAINATTDDSPPTVDLISSANLIRGGNDANVTHPLGELRLLAARVITRPAIER